MPPRPSSPTPPPISVSIFRMLRRIVVVVVFTAVVYLALDWAMEATARENGEMPWAQFWILVVLLLVYAGLLAIPFVPGVEIGVSLFVLMGAQIAPIVYLATVLGLTIAFMAGRHVPPNVLRSFLLDLRMVRACTLLDTISPLSTRRRLAYLRRALPGWMGNWPLQFRYVALALLINLPGSSLFGGGGGILFVAGFSRLFGPQATLFTISIAVLPVPLLVWVLGPGILD